MSDWINHVKKVQREEGVSYKEALQLAKHSYKGGSIKSEKIRNFIYKEGFNPDRMRVKSNFIKRKMYLTKTSHHIDDKLRKTDEKYKKLMTNKIGLKMSNNMINHKLEEIDDEYKKLMTNINGSKMYSNMINHRLKENDIYDEYKKINDKFIELKKMLKKEKYID